MKEHLYGFSTNGALMSTFARVVIQSTLLPAVQWLLYAPRPVCADPISFNLSSSTLTTTSGGTVTFDGTVTNDSGTDFNASDFFFNFSGYDFISVSPDQDLGVGTDFVIPSGTTSATVALFDVRLGNVPAGSSFPIQVQLEDFNSDLSSTQTVTVSAPAGVTGVPEPLVSWLLFTGLIIGLWRKRRSHRSQSPTDK